MTTQECPLCGAVVEDDEDYCPECGTDFEEKEGEFNY
ncbi:MAG: zinc ribbon domain-containing protein [Candidatus Woesearchaeota archaeon]